MRPNPAEHVRALLLERGVSARTLEAMAAVPREDFAPDIWWAPDGAGAWTPQWRAVEGDDVWTEALYSPDVAMTTQVDGGLDPAPGAVGERSTCSLSAPSIVARMLDAARVVDFDHVLELGGGQGWSAALTAHLAGPFGKVVTVEYDPVLADIARANLARAGLADRVRVVTGDGRLGVPEEAPFDAVIATASFDPIPHAWIGQASPGARIVAPLQSAFYAFGLFAGTVGVDGQATGRFADDANFMWDRGLGRLAGNPWHLFEHQGEGRESATSLNPAAVRASDPAQFAIGRLLPGVYQWVGRYEEPERAEDWTWWLYDGTSWAAVDYTRGADVFDVEQYGPRSLLDEVQDAHGWWQAAGQPAVDRFGLLLDFGGQRLTLDDAVIAERAPTAPADSLL